MDGLTIAEFNIFTRSSPVGRKSLKRILESTGDPYDIQKLKIEDDYTNQNAVILNAYMKGIGIQLEFETDDEDDLFYADVQTTMVIDGYTVVDFRSKKNAYHKLFEKFNEFMENYDVVQTYPGMKEDIAWDWVFSQQDSIEDIDWSHLTKMY